jgi:hypothetical protein
VNNPKEIHIMSVTTEAPAEAEAMRQSAKRLSDYLNDHLADETLGAEWSSGRARRTTARG